VDPESGESRGFGFIVFESTHSVDNVIKNLPHSIDGKRVDAKRQHLKTKNGDDKLFCGGVPSDFSDGQLADFFTTYGMVSQILLILHSQIVSVKQYR
jgi:RNA recognition motif-containing protein